MCLLAVLSGCGEKFVEGPATAPDCSAIAQIVVPTPASAQDFSALDPARCPPIEPEDLHGAQPLRALLAADSIIETKAFYVLALLEGERARQAVAEWPALASLAAERRQRLQTAIDTCGGDSSCVAQAVKFTETDIAAASVALVALHAASQPVQEATLELRFSGHAQLHAALADAELLAAAWRDAAGALNAGFDDYVAGLAPPTLAGLLASATSGSTTQVFFGPMLRLVLGGLEAGGRDEAERYEPLAEGENAAAVQRIACLNFDEYPFVAILVPGQGPMTLDVPLDPNGQIRADQAAARLAAGVAPLIVLSGGHVHPDRTPYSEAIEMKKYLMATYNIPEAALLIDPHARHTTTNLRNVGRLLYRYGVPTDRPALITSDPFQAGYIGESGARQIFGRRCLDELGYFPYRGISKLAVTDLCWIPSVVGLYADARDLLDP